MKLLIEPLPQVPVRVNQVNVNLVIVEIKALDSI